jgi:hypothetical protein
MNVFYCFFTFCMHMIGLQYCLNYFLFCNKNFVFINIFSCQVHIALVVEVIKIVNELFEYSQVNLTLFW